MKISVVLATYNRKDLLDNTISAFLSQDYNDKEIIVVDNGSTDGTKEMVLSKYPADKYPELKYIYLEENINIKAINIGIAISTGEIIWRSDDDAYLRDKDAFNKIAKIMDEHPEIGIICAALVNKDVENNIENYIKWYQTEIDYENVPDYGYQSHTFLGNGGAIRKELLNKVGYFWEFGYEEIELSTRAIVAGYKIRYYPDIIVEHYGIVTQAGKNYWRWDRITMQLLRYFAKYFPVRIALFKFFVVIFYQLLFAMKYKFSLLKILIGLINMLKTIYNTLMYERDCVRFDQVKEITLGESLVKGYNNRLFDFVKRRYSIEQK